MTGEYGRASGGTDEAGAVGEGEGRGRTGGLIPEVYVEASAQGKHD
jgi:hypothetical protein